MSRILIIGATSTIAKACARIWATSGPQHFVLVGRSEGDLTAIGRDLTARNPQASYEVTTLKFSEPAAIRALVTRIAVSGPIDIALIAHGWMPTQADSQTNLEVASESLTINGVSPTLFAEAIVDTMIASNSGTLGVIGSVAGDRGRKSNYTYGAAKSMVESYVRGLQHRVAFTPVKVVLIKPGPTDTPMTADVREGRGRLAPVDDVARVITKGMRHGRPTVYAPPVWRVIMGVVRALPAPIFNRLDL